MSVVDTSTEGNPFTVERAADWLRSEVQPAMERSGTAAQAARSHVGAGWSGQAASSYDAVARLIVISADDEAARVGRAATLLDDLAARMNARVEFMIRVREVASAAGLHVDGDFISHQDESGVTTPSTPEEAQRKQHENDLAELLEKLRGEVEEANDTFREYVDGPLAAAVAQQRDRGGMVDPGGIAVDLALNVGKGAVGAVSGKADLGIRLSELAVDTAKGDVDAGDLVKEVGGLGVEAVTTSTPGGVLGGALLETGMDAAEEGEGGRTALDPEPGEEQPEAEPGRPQW